MCFFRNEDSLNTKLVRIVVLVASLTYLAFDVSFGSQRDFDSIQKWKKRTAKTIFRNTTGYKLASKLYHFSGFYLGRGGGDTIFTRLRPVLSHKFVFSEIVWAVDISKVDGMPVVDFNKLHLLISNANAKLKKIKWVREWIEFSKDRVIHIFIHNDSYLISSDNEDFVKPIWKLAKLPGKPYMTVDLVHKNHQSIHVHFGSPEMISIVPHVQKLTDNLSWIGERKLHWLQQYDVWFHYRENPVKFIVIHPNGKHKIHSVATSDKWRKMMKKHDFYESF